MRPPQARDASALRGALTQGAVFRFRLVANVTRRIDTKTGVDGKRRNGKRVPLRDPERQLAWLARKGQEGGFQLVTDAQAVRQVRITPLPLVRSPRGRGVTLTIEAVRFDGLLRITDPDLCWAGMGAGIGPAKAYGCCLLSLGKP